MASLEQTNAIIDKLAAGGVVQSPPGVVFTICGDERYASTRLIFSSVHDCTHFRCTLAAGQKLMDQAATHHAWPTGH